MNSNDLIMLAHKVGVPIKKLSTRAMTKVNSAPQAQKRTATYKKAVYIVEALVFKGPYACDDPRLMNNLKCTYAIQLLEAVLQLPEWQRGSLQWEYIGCWDGNQYYLVAQNVGNWENISPKPAKSGLNPNAMIVPREMHVMRVSEFEGKALLTDDMKLAALQHLYLRYILGIGDSGTHNVLIRKDYDSTGRLIAGIDLEDKRGNIAKKSRLSFLFGKLYPKHIALYGSDIHKIKSLSYSQLDQHTIDRLDAAGIDLERLKENMELWKRLI
jgi:hypothetical protein